VRDSLPTPQPAVPPGTDSGGRGRWFTIRIGCYVAAAILGVAGFALWGLSASSSPAVTSAAVSATARENSGARQRVAAEAAAAALAQQNAQVCTSTFTPLLEALRQLDTDLSGPGLVYADYNREVLAANRRYGEATDHLDAVTERCIDHVGVPLENARNAYVAADRTWNNCISDLYCNSDSITPQLQAQWAKATPAIARAAAWLKVIKMTGDAAPGSGGGI
jgi:hypothetical protein